MTPRVWVPPLNAAPRAPRYGDVVHRLAGPTMGTAWRVAWSAPPRCDARPIRAAIEAVLARVVAQMSHWEPGSDLSRFNAAPLGVWQPLPAPFFDVLATALEIARDSGGAFDPAAGALVEAWGFGARRRHDQPGYVPPSRPEPTALWRELELDGAQRRARKHAPLQLDLSAIAKGHAVDAVSLALAREVEACLVEVGGELRGTGLRPDAQPWWIELEQPPALRVALYETSIATSGDAQQRWQRGALRAQHTVDPRSGLPLDNGVASVSVLHEQCCRADALATAIGVLGPRAGLRWADERGLAALIVAGREELRTAAFDASFMS